MSIRVLIADDQDLVRAGLSMIIDARDDLSVVGEAGDGLEAIVLAERLRPDVILMDVRMPRLDGIEATRRLVEAGNPARVIMLTTFDLDEPVFAALRAGASGFLLKDARRDELVTAVRVVAGGEALLAPTVTRRLIADVVGRGRPAAADPRVASRLAGLTARETETLRQVARGLSNAEIAGRLYVTEHTVKTHVSNLLTKLALRDRVQAVVLAYESGLVIAGATDPAPPARE
jgi:DNA-binding NarL/FixJ family response regulator